jgi:threonine/homoserine efflux transporter RhtA
MQSRADSLGPLVVAAVKLRKSADTFVIALAWIARLQIVTDEKPTGSLQPRVAGVPNCISRLE